MKLKAKCQTQIARYASLNTQLFCYSDTKNREELAHMVAIKHLSFNFCEKIDFVNVDAQFCPGYCVYFHFGPRTHCWRGSSLGLEPVSLCWYLFYRVSESFCV